MLAFSIIVPLYNKEYTVERAIRSVLNQTVQNFEIIVVNDGSTDGGPQVAKAIRDTRIRVIHQENQGVSAARNRGIDKAGFDLVAFLDADDEWKPAFLETIERLSIDFPHAAVFATSYFYCKGDGSIWAPAINGIPKHVWCGILRDYFAVAARSDPPIWSSAVAVKKEALRAVGGFPVGVTSGEDLLTWARLAIKYKIAFSSERLSIFHLEGNHSPSRLRRQPDDDDAVGKELHRLLEAATGRQKRSLRRYVGLWNKMRASVTLRAGRRRCALRHALRAMVLDPLNWGNYPLVAFSLLPANVGRWVVGYILDMRQRRRHP